MRRNLPIDSLDLHWDPKLLPSDGKKDVWDDDPPLFVGPGLIVSQGYEMGQNSKKIVEKRLEEWGRLESRVQEDIARMMGEFRVATLSIDERGASLRLAGQLREMLDPKASTVGAIQALSRIVRSLSELPQVEAAFDAEAHRATCEYCRRLFVWTHAPKCSNCGAPLAG
jgi:hypothetical protein